MLKKKLLAICFGLLPVTIAHALDGLYVGGSAGARFGSFDFNTKSLTSGLTVNKSDSQSNAAGSVFAGYGSSVYSNAYLGAEVGANLYKNTGKINRFSTVFLGSSVTDTMYLRDYVTADLLPGFKLNDELTIYGRLGLSYSRLKLHQSPLPANNVPVFELSQDKVGGRVGAGADYAFANNWSLGADYTYSFYPDFSTYWPLFNVTYRFKTKLNTVSAHLRYTFS